MKIAFDAFFLSEKNITGISTFSKSLINALSKIDTNNQYYLYTPQNKNKLLDSTVSKNPNFQIKEIKSFFFNRRKLWLQSPSLKKAIVKDSIDIFFGGGEYIPIFLPKKIKTVVMIHDLVYKLFPKTVSFNNYFFYKILFPISLRKANNIFTISNNCKNDIISFLKVKEQKIKIIISGTDVGDFFPKKDIQKEDFILFVGTLQPRKNLITLLKAYNFFAKERNEKLIIVGGKGWKSSDLANFVSQLEPIVKDKIEFKGYIDRQEVISLYQRAKLFVAPSLHEGFGIIILEAMASKTAVVTSPVGAIPEYFDKKVEFANPYDEKDLAVKIENLLDDENKRKSLIEKGFNTALSLTSEEMAKDWLEKIKIV